MKKILGFLIAVLMMSGVVITSGMISRPVFAAGTCDPNATFLGLRAWYYGLDMDSNCSPIVDGSSNDSFNGFVWQIILNIVFDLFILVGVIATGYVIYAGYAFLTAGGDMGKVAKAKKALIGAITGILVSLSATVIVNTITDAVGTDWNGQPEDVLSGALNLVFSVAGAIAAGFVVYGGISYITSSGDPQKARRARMILIYSIIGLLIVLLAAGIVNFVAGATE